MTPSEIAAIRERLEKAQLAETLDFSPQEGEARSCLQAQLWGLGGGAIADIEPTSDPTLATARAEFFAHAPADIDALLEEVDGLKAQLALASAPARASAMMEKIKDYETALERIADTRYSERDEPFDDALDIADAVLAKYRAHSASGPTGEK